MDVKPENYGLIKGKATMISRHQKKKKKKKKKIGIHTNDFPIVFTKITFHLQPNV